MLHLRMIVLVRCLIETNRNNILQQLFISRMESTFGRLEIADTTKGGEKNINLKVMN